MAPLLTLPSHAVEPDEQEPLNLGRRGEGAKVAAAAAAAVGVSSDSIPAVDDPLRTVSELKALLQPLPDGGLQATWKPNWQAGEARPPPQAAGRVDPSLEAAVEGLAMLPLASLGFLLLLTTAATAGFFSLFT